MNIVFAIFAALYASVGVATAWIPPVSGFFFLAFGFSLVKTFVSID